MFDFGVSSPGLGPVPRSVFKGTLEAADPDLSKKQVKKISNLFGDLLSSGADPAQVAFESSILSSRYPAEKAFQPGGSIYMDMLKERLGPQSKKETLADRDLMAQQVFGRGLTPEEKKYVKKERPSSQEFASYLYSSPSAYLASSPTIEEQKMAAYYGRMVPTKTKDGGTQWSGYSSSIEPLAYTGGIA